MGHYPQTDIIYGITLPEGHFPDWDEFEKLESRLCQYGTKEDGTRGFIYKEGIQLGRWGYSEVPGYFLAITESVQHSDWDRAERLQIENFGNDLTPWYRKMCDFLDKEGINYNKANIGWWVLSSYG